MPEYRVYIVDSDGHFKSAVALICADDEIAKEQAKQFVDGHDVELCAIRAQGRYVRAEVLKCLKIMTVPSCNVGWTKFADYRLSPMTRSPKSGLMSWPAIFKIS